MKAAPKRATRHTAARRAESVLKVPVPKRMAEAIGVYAGRWNCTPDEAATRLFMEAWNHRKELECERIGRGKSASVPRARNTQPRKPKSL